MCVRETESSAVPSAKTQGRSVGKRTAESVLLICTWCVSSAFVARVSGSFLNKRLVKRVQISNFNMFIFTWLLLNISLAKKLFCWLPKPESVWPNQTSPRSRNCECSKHSLFSDPFICWAFWFGSLSYYAWETFSGVLGGKSLLFKNDTFKKGKSWQTGLNLQPLDAWMQILNTA